MSYGRSSDFLHRNRKTVLYLMYNFSSVVDIGCYIRRIGKFTTKINYILRIVVFSSTSVISDFPCFCHIKKQNLDGPVPILLTLEMNFLDPGFIKVSNRNNKSAKRSCKYLDY